jgi:cytochrome c biogenesis protein CcmG/thiol:disulfide interchange protein DsbE
MSEASETKPASGPGPRFRPVMLLPLVLFAGLAAIFLMRLESHTGPDVVPSVLIGKPAPEFSLPALAGSGVPGLSRADLDGQVTLVNIFASWCVPCRQEHPVLEAIARDERIRVVGINYKDRPENARVFLNEMGNPYAAVGVDAVGRTFIDWGAYGVPETYLVGPDGIIAKKYIGPLTEEAVAKDLMPEIEKMLGKAVGS